MSKLQGMKESWEDEIERVEKLQKDSKDKFSFDTRKDYILELRAKIRAFDEIMQTDELTLLTGSTEEGAK